jgi:beta-lactamase superfamily II metal-dependent hydrolase
LAASLVAFAGGLPWSYFVFHLVTPVGIALNLLVLPLAFGILSLGLLSILSTPLGPVAPWLNGDNALLAGLLLDTVRLGNSLPGGHWAAATPFVERPDFVVFDAGEGAALLLDVQGKPWLFDCASAAQFESLLLPGLRFYGVSRLEGLLLSHGDAAHIGGALATQRAFLPRQLVAPFAKDRSRTRKQLTATLEASGHAPRLVGAGETLQQPPAPTVEILYPPAGSRASLADDKGLVVRFSTGRWSLLYTADAGFPTERWLLQHSPDRLQADVWVRGSNGRELTGTEAFVRAVNPALIVVAGTPFGRDAGAVRHWAEQCRAGGRTVWLQQETGAVEGWSGRDRRVRAFLTRSELRW